MPRWLPTLFRLLAVGLGAVHTWVAVVQGAMSEDGISYLDMGDAYLRGDWAMAINTVWSPLYACLLGLCNWLLRPSMAWEFSIVHIVNFALYLLALVCFEFFWRQFEPIRHPYTAGRGHADEIGLPDWAWFALGYTFFIWVSLCLIKIWVVTPDMLMSAIVYLAAGLLLRLAKGDATWTNFVLFGLILGVAYLTKSVMFPLAFIFLLMGGYVAGGWRWALPRILVSVLAFLLLAAPFVSVLSLSKGRLTFGDAGRLTFLRYANGIPYPHWQSGLVSGVGKPVHPARQIHTDPAVFEFASPIGGTYPLSYDPSYWYEGVVPRFDLQRQTVLLIQSALFYIGLFARQLGAVVAVMLTFSLTAPGTVARLRSCKSAIGLVCVALAAFGAYALVYVESRYIAVFLVLFWGALLACVRLPDGVASRRLLVVGSGIMVCSLLINIGAFNLEGLRDVMMAPARSRTSAEAPSYGPVKFARSLTALGLKRGDKIAFIGYAFGAFFARLARVQIVAEIPPAEAERFWHLSLPDRSDVMAAIAKTGATFIVADRVWPRVPLDGWERVATSRHFIYRFASP